MNILRLTEDTKTFSQQFSNVRNLQIDPEKLDCFISNPNNLAYFAVENSVVIGLVWGYVLERMDSEPMLYIHSVDVIPKQRRKGIGRMIMNEFIAYQNQNGLRNIFLITDADNFAANRLYQSVGGELETGKNLYIFK